MGDFLSQLAARRVLHQCTDPAGLAARFAQGVIAGYIGFDLTAPSLHVGSLIQIMSLRRLQQAGGRPIVVMGGGTTKVGDPSGRDESRQILTDDTIAANKARIRRIFERYLTFGDGPTDAIMLDNAEWLDGLAYVPFLREVGRHFSINVMIKMDSVRLRLEREQSLSFLEFNYMVLQAYDFVELHRRHGCVLQMGGSDQWGNIVAGIELGRKMGTAELFGVTSPLLTTASGAKMGKTAAGAVWLDADMLSPYDFWQFWRNTEDADVGRFLRIFTELPEAEIARLEALGGAEINAAKKVLATEVTALAHGRPAAEAAAETARQAFEEQTSASAGQGGIQYAGLPEYRYHFQSDSDSAPLTHVLMATGNTKSTSEARRLIENRGVSVNEKIVDDVSFQISKTDGSILISIGKKKKVRIILDSP